MHWLYRCSGPATLDQGFTEATILPSVPSLPRAAQWRGLERNEVPTLPILKGVWESRERERERITQREEDYLSEWGLYLAGWEGESCMQKRRETKKREGKNNAKRKEKNRHNRSLLKNCALVSEL